MLSLFLIIILFLFIILTKIYKNICLMRYCEKYENYISLLNYHMDICYQMIYKDKLLIYSIEATKINNKELLIVSKEFANLVLTMIGPNMKKNI
jgi:hypothetical protein